MHPAWQFQSVAKGTVDAVTNPRALFGWLDLDMNVAGIEGRSFIEDCFLETNDRGRFVLAIGQFSPFNQCWQLRHKNGSAGGLAKGQIYDNTALCFFKGLINCASLRHASIVMFQRRNLPILDHGGIQEIAVVCQRDDAGNVRLDAYAVPKEHQTTNTNDVLRFLRDRLPEYMVPSAIHWLSQLPVTPNGKIDRTALLRLSQKPPAETVRQAPRNDIEELLAVIWSDVLQLQDIDVYESFLALGGDSLSGTRIQSRILKFLEFDLPIRTIFEKPTIAELAGHIAELKKKGEF
jgi:hypothetical protein